MKKFTFRLQKVLELREREEDEKGRLLKLANAALREAESLFQLLEGKRADEGLSQGDDNSACLYGWYLARLLHEIDKARENIKIQQNAVEVARDNFLKARQKAESLRKLRERRLIDYNRLLNASEERFIDEISMLRYTRDNKASE
jgi:flagellar FliJ protein